MSAPAPTESGRRLHILVVDDEAPIRSLIKELLGREGYDVEMAAAAGEALQLTQLMRWDAVVLDIDLPDMSGLELYGRMRREGECLPVVFITGRPVWALWQYVRLMPWARLLPKPFDCAEFLRSVAHCARGEAKVGGRGKGQALPFTHLK